MMVKTNNAAKAALLIIGLVKKRNFA